MTQSLVMASSILLLGANAYAAKVIPGKYGHVSRYEVMETTAVDTKDKAYSLGFQKLQALKKLGDGKKLSEELGLHLLSPREKSSTNLESGYVTVQEFMNENGDIMYRGRVNINYHFSIEEEYK
jgi:hypothetical protein